MTGRLEDLLGIELPIIQAPMAGVQDSALAIAACNAGALGSLPCALISIDTMRDEVAAIRAATRRPLNVNFFCHPTPPPDVAREAAWRAALAPYYRELGIDPASIPSVGRAAFDDAAADALEAAGPPAVVSFHFGLPPPPLLDRVRRWGSKILSSATTVDEARWLEARGVDAVIAQGLEAGGHRGMFLSEDLTTQVGTFALVPQIASAVRIPVIAAGGIADARGAAAARALGADGVQVGTAFLLCPEATTSPPHRDALASSALLHTAVTNVFTGRPSRGIVNRIVRELGPMSSIAPAFPLAAAATAPLRVSPDLSPLWAGQAAAACRAVPAADVIRALVGNPT